MNKQERKLKGQAKFKKRIKNYGYTNEDILNKENNLYCFKTTSKPCSCWMCRNTKDKKIKHKNKLND